MEDKRVIKTKKNLKATLIELMEEIPFEQISITELCRRAEISRITFYTHYSDKYALADEIFDDMLRIGTEIYHIKQKQDNPHNDLVLGFCNMLDSILEVYYDCFEFFQYTSPGRSPYLAFAFYRIVLDTIEKHTHKIQKNMELKYSSKKIAGFLCFGMLGFINEAHGEKTSLDVIKKEANQLLKDMLQSGVLVR
ncbi:MAG: TetR/AcrR family transcriptional regulator [[Ruminococcus] gnavus]|nr:TetR/AcrR family transcriptional regulator [Mediterraneibacter gnavus]